MAEKKYLDENGLLYYDNIVKNRLNNKVNKELKTGSESEYKVLSDNNLTDELKQKILNAGDSSFSGNYDDLTNKPDLTVYAKTVDVTKAISDATSGLASQEYVDSKITSVYKYKGSVANRDALPTENLEVGDTYNLEDSGMNTAWNGTNWDDLGSIIDLTGYVKEEDLVPISNEEIENITQNS